ncbi:unnamed protein product [Rhizophagus irregularis]|nr:unnamed protein product [Rhizophagus irregularis]
MTAETKKKLIIILLIGLNGVIRIVSLSLASVASSRSLRSNIYICNIGWAVIMFLLVLSDIAVNCSVYFGWTRIRSIYLTRLFLILGEMDLLVLSLIEFRRCQPEDLCQANDTFKVYITTCDCLSLIYVLIRIAISRTSSRGGLEADLLDVLRENDNPENPVPPVVDKIVEGNKNINRGTDEITIPRLDEDSTSSFNSVMFTTTVSLKSKFGEIVDYNVIKLASQRKQQSRIKRIMESSKIPEILFKNDTSRIIQTVLKYGTKEQKKIIVDELEGKWLEASKHTRSKFVICKVLIMYLSRT